MGRDRYRPHRLDSSHSRPIPPFFLCKLPVDSPLHLPRLLHQRRPRAGRGLLEPIRGTSAPHPGRRLADASARAGLRSGKDADWDIPSPKRC
jgi:hypothetical protein